MGEENFSKKQVYILTLGKKWVVTITYLILMKDDVKKKIFVASG